MKSPSLVRRGLALLLALLYLTPAVAEPAPHSSRAVPQALRARVLAEEALVPASEGALVPWNGSGGLWGYIQLPGLAPPGLVLADGGAVGGLEACALACNAWQGTAGAAGNATAGAAAGAGGPSTTRDASTTCNVFTFCNSTAGCSTWAEALPFGACKLRHQGISSPGTGRPVVALAGPPGAVGGALVRVTSPDLPGYTRHPGWGFHNRFDFACEGSLLDSACLLQGSLVDLAARCDAEPQCSVLQYFPEGRDYLGPSMALLKGGRGVTVDLQAPNFNQNSILYIKQNGTAAPAPPAPDSGGDGGGGLSSGAIAGKSSMAGRASCTDRLPITTSGIAVGAGMAAAAAAAGAFVLVKRRQQRATAGAKAASAPTEPKDWVDEELGEKDSQQQGSVGVAAAGGVSRQGVARAPGSAGSLPATKRESFERDALQQASRQGSNSGAGGPGTPAATTQWASVMPLAAAGASLASSDSGAEGSRPAALGSTADAAGLESNEQAAGGSLECHHFLTSSLLLASLPNDSDWRSSMVPFNRLEFCCRPDGELVELGAGASGSIYKVLLDGVQPLAAKVIELGGSPGVQLTFMQETALLRRLRHRNIVGFAGVCVNRGRGIILMELMEGRDLHSMLSVRNRGNQQRTFGWYGRGKRVAMDAALGMHYLHSLQIVHYDIKSSNILLSRDLTAKIGDVGLSRVLSTTFAAAGDGNGKGTFAYMAPELLAGRPCSQAVDIYSFGILLWEICTGEHPLRGRNRPLQVPEDCPQEVADLIGSCTLEDPAARPTARDLVHQLRELTR